MSNKAMVLVTTSFPIDKDGSEAAGSFVSDLAEELAKYMPVRIVAPGPTSCQEEWAPNVSVFRYAAPSKPLSTLKLWKPADLLAIVRVIRAGMTATRAAVEAGLTVHLLAFWALPSGEWARRVARQHPGLDFSVWMLGSDIWTLGRIPGLRWMLARVMRQAKRAYADGYQLAEDAKKISAVPVAFLPSTRRISITDPPPPRVEPPYRLLFLGRWHPNKGVDLLLDALARLDDEDWARIACVEIQGGGPLELLVKARIAALRAADRPVEFGRFLAKHEAEAAIVRADWVLIPSRIESIPVVFSDAMKLGRPVIVMPVGDLSRLQSIYSIGYVASGVTANDFAHALSEAIHGSASRFRKGLRDAGEYFDLGRVIVPKIMSELTDEYRGSRQYD